MKRMKARCECLKDSGLNQIAILQTDDRLKLGDRVYLLLRGLILHSAGF
jgi:hypothetical protein